MKSVIAATLCFIASVSGFAQNSFPGLKSILSETEWKRAGLDRLSPDEVGVIDAALIRHHVQTVTEHQSALAAVQAATPASAERAAEPKRGLWERFGLPTIKGSDWRDLPPLQATVTEWISANRFKLDNGQVWEGLQPITYELVGKPIEIHARPSGQFALTVDGKNTTLRVTRLR